MIVASGACVNDIFHVGLLLNQKTQNHEKSIQTPSVYLFHHRNRPDADRHHPGHHPFYTL